MTYINSEFVKFRGVNEIPTIQIPSTSGKLFYYEGNGRLKTFPVSYLLSMITIGFQQSINPSTIEPEDGWQKGYYLAEVSGTYNNAGDIVVDLSNGFTFLTYDGENWTSIELPTDVQPIVEKYFSLTNNESNPELDFLNEDSFINQENGVMVVDTPGFSATDFIPVPSWVEKINLTQGIYQQYALYDINKAFYDSDFSIDGKTEFLKPDGVYFIRLSASNPEISRQKITFSNPEYLRKLSLTNVEYDSNRVVASALSLEDGFFINQNNGQPVSVDGWSASDYFEIPDNVEYIKTSATYQQFSFYDSDRDFIPYQDTTVPKIYQKPSNAKYIRVTVKNNEVSAWFMRLYTQKELEVLELLENNSNTITVTADNYNAIQIALDSITNASAKNRYEIKVSPGLYKADNSSKFNNPSFPAFVMPKDHVDIIGESKEDTVVWAELPYNDADIDTGTERNSHQTVYNWADDCLIKNITFVAKNIRYALHQDYILEAEKTRRYENCDFIFIGNKGSMRGLGIGTWSGSKTFVTGGKSVSHTEAPFAIHNAANQANKSLWHFKNHEFQSYLQNEFAVVQNSGSLVGDDLILENCSFTGNIMDYKDWWIYTPNVNDHFNHAEWRIKGSGNKPFYFNNTVNGKSLRITAQTIGDKVRVDKTSSAYSLIFGNNKKTFGFLGHPERKIVDGYIVQDFDNGFKSFAIGGLSIREDNYLYGTTTSQDSLGKRLGNCSVVNKTLSVDIGNITVNVLFNQNYTSQSNATIISSINAQLGVFATADEYNIGLDYFPELTDVNVIKSNYETTSIPKGSLVRDEGGVILMATETSEIAGVAFDNFQGRTIVNGEVKGVGRVVSNCILHKNQIRLSSGLVIQKDKRYTSNNNGELVENAAGKIVAIDDNLLMIK